MAETKYDEIQRKLEANEREEEIKAYKKYKEVYALKFKQVEANVIKAKEKLTAPPKINEGTICCIPYKDTIYAPKVVEFLLDNGENIITMHHLQEYTKLVEYWCNIHNLKHKIDMRIGVGYVVLVSL